MTPAVLHVNGGTVPLDPDGPALLVEFLRNDLGLKATRFGCGLEQCGACMVLVDGVPTHSCSRRAAEFAGRAVTTVEGLSAGGLHPLQQALIDEQAGQCGFCLSGILISGVALLAANPVPSRAEIVAALDGHLCRCGVQPRVVAAVERAAAELERRRGDAA
ncbi:(2Fe-2S)-binding protein [Phreatobacter sp. AB_2022a]|uniref:(2Fe-2S)-binding protein n=1 Tax=Phreatobacter sp. AB_2022a TaxID=3003134 RepID=UPI0022871CAA|nr:2Fe-2S iron-sulfur cluster-binding protein [Phreatobacter sp. AB_2022a]MCZ0734237.1 2Fe-2S iron-sulfur cluster-binding protein [Phreatobacter sp. AB_2022a]